MIKTRRSASGKPFVDVGRTNQEAPTIVLTVNPVALSVKKKFAMTGGVSSMIRGSSVPPPATEAGTSMPIVAKLSSASSGKVPMNAGFNPDAFQLPLNALLNAPPGVCTESAASPSPYTALNLSVGDCI